MCGIAGFVIPTSSSRSIDDSKLISMRDALSHRGPDEAGIHRDARVALLHRRLSIVDLTSGQQPMSNEDGSHWIVYNGEVYNHAEQRSDLEARGHHYRSHCDTETILHLYEEYGPAGIQHLRGMFAFAIWNSRKRELFIARDRLGVKPVYYAQAEDGTLWFASEIKALIAAGAVKPALRLSSLPEYLANHATCGEETLYEGVRRLLPGHHLTWIDGRTRIERYWDIPPQVAGPLASLAENDVVEQWGQLLETSVRLRLMADVPLGMFLSGGIDSSAIAALMSGMVSDPIKTFSVAFAEREANELEYARVVARAFQTDHHEVIVSADQFFQALPRLIWHEDEPLAHPSSVPLFFVSQLASRYVKVVLTGEGSDELLAGYYRYRKTILNLSVGRWYHRLVPSPARSAFRAGFGTLPHPVVDKLRRTFLWLPPDVSSLYFDNFAVFSTAMLGSLLSSDARARIGALQPHADLAAYFDAAPAESLLGRLLYADLKTYLHELLMKQDQMSMAASIESRVPFLDHRLVEFTAGVPEHLKLRGWTTKYILRQAMKSRLPDAILQRPKMGFPVPIGRWLRTSHRHLLDETILSDRALSRGLFDPASVRRLVAEHDAGHGNHWERLWTLLNFELWQRQAIDGEIDLPALPVLPEARTERAAA